MLHCHTTIRGRKYLAVVIEGVGGVDQNIECLFIRQTSRRLQLDVEMKPVCIELYLMGSKACNDAGAVKAARKLSR